MDKTMRSQDTATPDASAVKRAFRILECLGDARRGLNISEISRKLRIPKSSVHVIVLTLERLGYIERQSSGLGYSLGRKASFPGHVLGRKALLLAGAAQPQMRVLVEGLTLSACLVAPEDDQGVVIQKLDALGTVDFKSYVGRRIDLHCTAAGKVILAFGNVDVRNLVLSQPAFTPHTPKTIVNPRILMRELEQTKKLGFAFNDEEDELNVRSVAVPVISGVGRFVGSLSVTGKVSQITAVTLDSIVAALKQAAGAIGSDKAEHERTRNVES